MILLIMLPFFLHLISVYNNDIINVTIALSRVEYKLYIIYIYIYILLLINTKTNIDLLISLHAVSSKAKYLIKWLFKNAKNCPEYLIPFPSFSICDDKHYTTKGTMVW